MLVGEAVILDVGLLVGVVKVAGPLGAEYRRCNVAAVAAQLGPAQNINWKKSHADERIKTNIGGIPRGALSTQGWHTPQNLRMCFEMVPDQWRLKKTHFSYFPCNTNGFGRDKNVKLS